jgi:hypothetical protein
MLFSTTTILLVLAETVIPTGYNLNSELQKACAGQE